MDTHDELQAGQPRDLETLARHIEWQLKGKPFYIVFEDELERYWPFEKLTDAERERQIQAFAESWLECFHAQDRP